MYKIKQISKNKKLSTETRDEFIRELADRHGTGRVLFRNTRKTITGFPKRVAKLNTIKVGSKNIASTLNQEEFKYDMGV